MTNDNRLSSNDHPSEDETEEVDFEPEAGPIMLPHGASCATCAYSDLAQPNPQVLQRVRLCRRHPPVPVLVQQQTAQGVQGSFLTVFPTVADTMVCFEFDENPTALNGVIPTGLG